MLELCFENLEHVVYYSIKINFSFCDHLAAFFDIRSNLWKNQLWVNLTIALD
jgi:hypothetical protein